jgi:hypothetical protein
VFDSDLVQLSAGLPDQLATVREEERLAPLFSAPPMIRAATTVLPDPVGDTMHKRRWPAAIAARQSAMIFA